MAPIATHDSEEDPMDDFALSLRNAERWAESKVPIGPEGTFYLFAEMAPEIREKVWLACIPSRIHLACETVRGNINERVHGDHRTLSSTEAHEYGLYSMHGRHCRTVYPRTLGKKSHFISRVNKEVYDIANRKEYGSVCSNLAFVYVCAGMTSGRIVESPVWVNKDTDTVLINTQYINPARWPANAVFRTIDGILELKEDRLFAMATKNKIKVAIFATILTDLRASPTLYHDLARANRVELVVGAVSFEEITDKEAAATGLFGLFGEESMCLLPADTVSLQKLFRAKMALRHRRVAEFLEGSEQWYAQGEWPQSCEIWAAGRRLPD
ncbi:hypothetical protein KVR01_000710 [Diaporthe batatas]|uniref:uncharacterized protein n=1 Tax=Diaporthe batatas TaxID=748121 RepID=UPI001D0460B1|nr:uncharacterized protein KVR01_000710 [Diaporthe batatas]KAG8169965.1 hypothetical protein KVR01_000710 [Diaporthe batatas]